MEVDQTHSELLSHLVLGLVLTDGSYTDFFHFYLKQEVLKSSIYVLIIFHHFLP